MIRQQHRRIKEDSMKDDEIMTATEFENEMKKIQEQYNGDIELVHYYMDELMAKLLKKLGYGKGIKVFESQRKWYA